MTIPGLATSQTDFQVKITLDGSFSFTNTNTDGSDIRITASDGTTLIPFWIESWAAKSPTRSDTLWVKVPTLPTGGLTVYLYYGNPAPTTPPQVQVETPPGGPYTKNPTKITPINLPAGRTHLVAENIVKDDAPGGHYWMVFTDQTQTTNPLQICLAYSDDPTNPNAWYWGGVVITNGIAPHIMKYNGTWYIFYGDRNVSSPWPISVATATTPGGPYTYAGQVLQAGAANTWEDLRADEPCVFWNSSMNKWILIYMGDSGGNMEQIGYATADDILGPYTKYAGNPCLAFGPAGTFDAGTVADPWVYNYHGVYYIGYTVSPTTFSPWQTALATTTDWTTFTKHGIILPLGSEYYSFRGDVILIGDQYVFSYTGGASGNADLSLATQPVYQNLPSPINNGNVVFDFFDGFSGTSLDLSKWYFANGTIALTSVADGLLTMTTQASPNNVARILGLANSGMNYMGESRARHPSQGTLNLVGEVGFADANWNTVRILDDYPSPMSSFWRYSANIVGHDAAYVDMPQTANQNWHIFHAYRQGTETAGFQIDSNTPVTVSNAYVPTIDLPPFLMSYSSVTGTNNTFIVDWTRVRKWAGSDPVPVAGSEESLNTQWTGSVSSDWGTSR